jgi:predicted nucleic acid-binding protein
VIFILDTNVLSELMRATVEPCVLAWVTGKPSRVLFTTSLCEAEILSGIGRLPPGRKRLALTESAETLFGHTLAGRVLPFDSRAAPYYAAIVEDRRRAGRPMPVIDALIAAVALANGAGVATRDADLSQVNGLSVVDPWSPL